MKIALAQLNTRVGGIDEFAGDAGVDVQRPHAPEHRRAAVVHDPHEVEQRGCRLGRQRVPPHPRLLHEGDVVGVVVGDVQVAGGAVRRTAVVPLLVPLEQDDLVPARRGLPGL